MPNYQNTKIYKIFSTSNPDLVYYGSTTKKLGARLSNHKSRYKKWKMKKTKNMYKSWVIFDKCDDVKIELVEKFPCSDSSEGRERERYYIESNICVNKQMPNRTVEETNKIYYQNNKVDILNQQAKYREANRDLIRAKAKAKVNCICGAYIRRDSMAKHKRSVKHNTYIQDNI